MCKEPEVLFVDTREAAKILSLTPGTLRTWRCTGKGPEFIKTGEGRTAKVLYPVTALKAWAESRKKSNSIQRGRVNDD